VCWCDRQQIEQVVTNLLKNGVESLYEKGLQDPDHKGYIRVLLSEDDTFITLVFEDNGCGLPSELTDRFAEPYWTTKATGTGLGLAIVKKIAEDHGGEVVLSPSLHEGAIARVTLRRTPVIKQPQDT
jgi:two-component system nitrogen regulation sensor histidine kinase NtrY